MLNASTITRGDSLEALFEAEKAKPKKFRKEAQKRLSKYNSQLLSTLRAENPRPPSKPFIWSYNLARHENARRYYYATKVPKGSKGGSYKRTQALQKHWKTRINLQDFEGLIILENDMPGAEYVIGDLQVPGHKGRWMSMAQRVEQASDELYEEVVDLWVEVMS